MKGHAYPLELGGIVALNELGVNFVERTLGQDYLDLVQMVRDWNQSRQMSAHTLVMKSRFLSEVHGFVLDGGC